MSCFLQLGDKKFQHKNANDRKGNPRVAKRAVKRFFDTPTARIITNSLLFASPPIVSKELRVTVTGRSSTRREPELKRTTCIELIR